VCVIALNKPNFKAIPILFFSLLFFDRGFELSIHTLSVCKQRRQISVSQMFESQNSFFLLVSASCFVRPPDD